jgi:uncharacterized protein YciI/uncharacterized protein YndB with AHSA1/START domain
VTSVKKQIVVETSQQRAFRTFTEGMARWWPRGHHASASPLERMVLEPRPGGRWYSVCEDGSEVGLGAVLAWEPPGRLVLSWQVTAQWQYDPTFSTEIEISFHAETPRRTRVELEHKQLERFGADASDMAKKFAEDGAWALSLKQFADAAVASKYVMIYDTTPAGLAQAPAHYPGHRDRLDLFCRRGTLLMAGPMLDPSTPGRALGVFTSREAVEDFVREDPFILHGVVTRWTIVEWKDVLY